MSLSSPANSPLASPVSPFPLGGQILYESYLHKTPPLDRLFVSWKKRWFVLSRTDPHNPSTLDLSYYVDRWRKVKKGTVDLAKFVGIRPNAKVGQKENVFAVETEDRKYILRAPDSTTKDIWLAKLCELCGQEQVYHVTIPNQPSSVYTEAILKLTSPSHVTVVVPSTGDVAMEIPYGRIRRVGCMDSYGLEVIWFETCKQSMPDELYFFTIASGSETAHNVIRELKLATECGTGALLIMEESDTGISFISREHYGCQEFPVSTRGRILNAGLKFMSSAAGLSAWRPFLGINPMRRVSEPVLKVADVTSNGVSLEDWAGKLNRRQTSADIHPLVPTRRPTLDKFRQLSSSSHDSDDVLDGSDSSGDIFDTQSHSPARKHSHQSSLSSREFEGSGASLHYSPSIPEDSILEDPFEQFEDTYLRHSMSSDFRRPSAPNVPPRSIISLQQTVTRRKMSAVN